MIFKYLVQSKGLNSLMKLAIKTQKNNKEVLMRNDEFFQQMLANIYATATEDIKKEYMQEVNEFIEKVNDCARPSCKFVQLAMAEALKSIFIEKDDQIKAMEKILLQLRETIQQEQFEVIHEQVCQLIQEQIMLSDQTEEQKSKKKESLSFSLLKLEERAEDELKKHEGKKCPCQQQCQYICLLCEAPCCQNCLSPHCKSGHNNIRVFLKIRSLSVLAQRKQVSEKANPYTNEFKILYHEKLSHPQCKDEENFMPGSGGTGHVATQIARCLGSTQVTSICSSRNIEFCKSYGSNYVIDYTKGENNIISDLVHSPQQPYHFILDCVSSADPHDQSINYPNLFHSPAIAPQILAENYIYRRLGGPTMDWIRAGLERTLGLQWWKNHHEKLFWIRLSNSSIELSKLKEWAEDGKLRPHISKVFEFTEEGIIGAFDMILSRRVLGKTVVDMQNDTYSKLLQRQ